MKQCIVSGMEIKNLDAAPRSDYKGTTYYFCCKGCKAKFDRQPEKYLNVPASQSRNEGRNCGCC